MRPLHALLQRGKRTAQSAWIHSQARPWKHHPRDPAAPFTLHLGHHFWGMGNVGDDFMLEGFLRGLREHSIQLRITCCALGDRSLLATRFPEIEWRPYTLQHRLAALSVADVWVGLGGTPFQNDSGDWMELHLDEERRLCHALNVPMDFLAIGVGNRSALQQPRFRQVIEAARYLWVRDEASYEVLAPLAPGRVSLAADLANILFQQTSSSAPLEEGTGLLIHSEQDHNKLPLEMEAWIQHQTQPCFWLVQEQRSLPGSEMARWEQMSAQTKHGLLRREPDWRAGSVAEILHSWPFPAEVISSRYHGALLAAWRGAALHILARNDKLSALAQSLGLEALSAGAVWTSPTPPQKVERPLLEQLAQRAKKGIASWVHQLAAPLRQRGSRKQSASSQLFFQSSRRLLYRTLLGLCRCIPPGHPSQHFSLTILKLDKLGDAILALGAIRSLIAHYGEADTLLIVSPLAAPLMRREFPQATILTLPAFCERLYPDLAKTLLHHAPHLRAISTDTLVCLRHQPSDYLHGITGLIRPNKVYHSTWADSQENLSLAFDRATSVAYPARTESMITCRELQAHQRVVEAALGQPITEAQIQPHFRSLQAQAGEKLLICPSTGSALREYPLPLLTEALQTFQQQSPGVVIRVCLPPEEDLQSWQSALTKAGLSNLEWIVPKDALMLIEEVAQTGVLLAPESAPAHIATALDKPGVFLLGGGHRGLLAPWQSSPRQQWLCHRMPCEGCHWSCIQEEARCITHISPQEVAAALVKAYALSRQK